jgi:hypothetical protein
VLLAAGLPARSPRAPAGLAGASRASRPEVALDPSALPHVTVSSGVRDVDASVTDAGAQRMGVDLAADLLIEAEALRRRDPDLAATAAAEVSLQRFRQDIDAARRSGAAIVPSYRFTGMSVVVVRDPARPQAPPQLAVDVRGAVSGTTYQGPSPTPAGGHEEAPYQRTFTLALAGGHYLITAERGP